MGAQSSFASSCLLTVARRRLAPSRWNRTRPCNVENCQRVSERIWINLAVGLVLARCQSSAEQRYGAGHQCSVCSKHPSNGAGIRWLYQGNDRAAHP